MKNLIQLRLLIFYWGSGGLVVRGEVTSHISPHLGIFINLNQIAGLKDFLLNDNNGDKEGLISDYGKIL